jgi:hypothetical protein
MTAVLSPILQDVDDGVSNLTRRGERARVVAIVKHAAVSAEGAIHAAGNSDFETRRAPSEPDFLRRFHDEVNVIGLHGKVQNAKSPPTRVGDVAPNPREKKLTP